MVLSTEYVQVIILPHAGLTGTLSCRLFCGLRWFVLVLSEGSVRWSAYLHFVSNGNDRVALRCVALRCVALWPSRSSR